MTDISVFLEYPTGKITKGDFCSCCARYNSRYTTTNVIVWHDNRVLLVQRGHDPAKNLWAIPGGYLAWDETVEQSAQRELKEETGLTSGLLELVAVVSDHSAGDRQNLDLIFLTRSFTGTPRPQQEEVQALDWFNLDSLPKKTAFSHDTLLRQLEPVLTGQQSGQPVLVI